MGYAESLLADGERVVLRERQHPLAVVIDARWAIAAIVGSFVLLIVGGALDPTGIVGTIRQLLGWLTLILFVVGLAWLALTIANWMVEEYLVTNRRVVKVDG